MTPELLAPSGDISSLKASIASGANAVYLGLSAFNARIKADNFSYDSISEVVEYCHLFSVKVYVTVNTAVKNAELPEIDRLITACKNAKVDAFIICDFAVLDAVKRIAPEIPLHASTQLGVCNLDGAKYAEALGFTRVVLSREATIAEIKAIKQNTSLEIEYFVHGALCVAFSGKCLLSSITNGGSGNRGRCLQPCRLCYTEKTNGESGYLLSTSDLCLIKRLKEISTSGVDSIKIEGRLRRPQYVYNVVKTYRKVLDNHYNVTNKDINTLKAAYNRGNFTEGYSFDDTEKLMSVKVQNNIGRAIGKILSVKNGYSKVEGNYQFKIGEGVKLFDEKGVEAGGGRIDRIANNCPLIIGAKTGYFVNVTSEVSDVIPEATLFIDTEYLLNDEGILSVTYKCNGASATVKNETPLSVAENKPLDEAALNTALTKFGADIFTCKNVSGEVSGSFFAPHSVLNELRRAGIAKLKEKLLQNYSFANSKREFPESIIKNPLKCSNLVAVELNSISQLSKELAGNADVIVYYPDVYSADDATSFVKAAKALPSVKVYLKTTVNARENDVKLFRSVLRAAHFDGVYADNLYAIQLAKDYNIGVFLGQGLNIYNKTALGYFAKYDYYMTSVELSSREISEFDSPFVFAFGAVPLMNLSHCVNKLIKHENCAKCTYKQPFIYSDRKQYEFRIARNKAENCYFTLYNSKITDISAKYLNNNFNYYLNMLQCDKTTVSDVAASFKRGKAVNTADYTNGWLSRGVL